LDLARELLTLGQGKIVLPSDFRVVPPNGGAPQVVEGEIPDGYSGMDIGPRTIEAYKAEIAKARTVVWNGPVGRFEEEAFSVGTKSLAEALASSKALTIVGGGETAEAVEAFGLAEKLTHVSTGGGAFLEYVEGTPFKALAEIDEK
jgi:phosphoglycerate kinase